MMDVGQESATSGPWYVRFRATTPNSRGIRPGIFALVNGLYNDGLLSPDEVAFRDA